MSEACARARANRPRIVIVGGGIAGLSSAMALSSHLRTSASAADWDIVLIESRSRAGGRAGSFSDPHSGETLDYCQHVVMGCCTNFLSLLREAELIEQFTRYDELQFYHPTTGISRFRSSRWLPAPLHLHSALAGLRYLSGGQRHQIRTGMWKLMRATESVMTPTDAGTWLAENGQDAEVRARFWDVILISALGDVPERVSIRAARKVIIDGFAAARGASDVWVPNGALSHIFGRAVVQRLVARGVSVRTGTTARQILQRCGESRVSISIRGGDTIVADHVVLATNWRSASRFLQSLDIGSPSTAIASWRDGLQRTLASIQPSPITGVHLWLDRVLTRHPHVVMVGTTAQWLFSDPVGEAGSVKAGGDETAGHYHQVVISGRHALSDAPNEVLIEHLLGELRAAFPGAEDVRLLRSRTVTDPASVYRLSDELDSRRPLAATPLDWLHLAGDYVQTGWPSTMEGAVISGRMAAESILHQVNDGRTSSPSLVCPGLRRGRFSRHLIRENM